MTSKAIPELNMSYEAGMNIPLITVARLAYGLNYPRYLVHLGGLMAVELTKATKANPSDYQAFIAGKSRKSKHYRRLRRYALRVCWGGNV